MAIIDTFVSLADGLTGVLKFRTKRNTETDENTPVHVEDETQRAALLAKLQDAIDVFTGVKEILETRVAALPPRPLLTDVAKLPARTLISVSGADTDELKAAETGKRIFLFRAFLQTDIAVVLTLKSSSTVISQTISLAAGDALRIDYSEYPEFWTAVGEALNITKSTAATLTGYIDTAVA